MVRYRQLSRIVSTFCESLLGRAAFGQNLNKETQFVQKMGDGSKVKVKASTMDEILTAAPVARD